MGRWDGRPQKGDTEFTVRLQAPDGGPPAGDAVVHTKQILLERMKAVGLERPTVTPQGGDTLLVTAAHQDAERARALLVPGNLTFRLVLGSAQAPGTAGCAADPQAPAGRDAALASAKAKLGDAYDAAVALTEPADDSAAAGLAAFKGLTCAEVAALPAAVQYNVPVIGCAMLDTRPGGAVEDAAQGVACGDGQMKYLMDVAKVTGSDLAGASARHEDQIGQWTVLIKFTAGGQPRWTGLTQQAMDKGNAQVAVLVDNHVVTAPVIQSVIAGDAQVTGGGLSTQEGADALAATLSHGVLPLRLVITRVGSTP
jgi:preprotein translocase subunit SecD